MTGDPDLPDDWVGQMLRAYVAFGMDVLAAFPVDADKSMPALPRDWMDRVTETYTAFAESPARAPRQSSRTQQQQVRRAAPRAGERWTQGQEDPEWVRRSATGQFGPGPRARIDLAEQQREQAEKRNEESIRKYEEMEPEEEDGGIITAIKKFIKGLFEDYNAQKDSEESEEDAPPPRKGKQKFDFSVHPDEGKKEPIQSFSGREAKQMLIEAGHGPGDAGYLAQAGTIHTRDGKSIIFTPNEETKRRQYEDAVQYDGLEKSYDRYQKSPEEQEDDIESALNRLEYAAETRPEWAKVDENGKPRNILAEINDVKVDALAAADGDTQGGTVYGYVYELGENAMVLQSGMQNRKTGDIVNNKRTPPSFAPDLGRETDALEQVITHEMGHLVDVPPESWDPGSYGPESNEESSLNDRNVPFWENARNEKGMTRYGQTMPEEGYAEMYKQWAYGNTTNATVQKYAEYFGWNERKK